jgi:hypothetical protein
LKDKDLPQRPFRLPQRCNARVHQGQLDGLFYTHHDVHLGYLVQDDLNSPTSVSTRSPCLPFIGEVLKFHWRISKFFFQKIKIADINLNQLITGRPPQENGRRIHNFTVRNDSFALKMTPPLFFVNKKNDASVMGGQERHLSAGAESVLIQPSQSLNRGCIDTQQLAALRVQRVV